MQINAQEIFILDDITNAQIVLKSIHQLRLICFLKIRIQKSPRAN